MKYILLVSLFVFSSFALAAKPYGMAGCGLGSSLIGKDDGQISAATSNWTGTQTFGISSGTSNCVTATDQTAKIKNFIEANYASLITDMAKGRGDSVSTLSGFYGCNSDVFATEMKSHYETITSNTEDATFMMVKINKVMEDSQALNSACSRAI